MKKKQVIITADDFGLWPEINDAVIQAYENGVVTSAALRVTATASHSAAVAALIRPGLAVGLHLVLCEGTATLPRRHIPNLVDSTGRFVSRPLEAAWHYRRRAGLREELRAEVRAQIEKFLATGLNLTFVSGHFHLHLHPTVLGILKELAGEYPILALRRPCTELPALERRESIPRSQARLEVAVLRQIVRWGGLRSRGFVSPDRVEMLSLERPATESAVIDRLGRLRRGVTELVCHPGSLLPRYDGTGEAAVINSPLVRQKLADSDLEPISYRNLIEDC